MKVLITAGPTREKIDNVRFISNYSSGKMGYAIADYAYDLGYDVYIISGPVNIKSINNLNPIMVESADEMYSEVLKIYKEMDILIFAAAVADFKPVSYVDGKIKKNENHSNLLIELKENPDILANIGKIKNENQIVVGFALESENEVEHAFIKLKRKNCDLIILNSANKPNSGFDGDYNTITIIDKYGGIEEKPTMLKSECAKEIFIKINSLLNKG